MLSIFACPKPFTNPHTAVIQCNALLSWTLLRPRPEITLFGDEPGIEEIARELRLGHFSEIARNDAGTPLVSDLFEQGQRRANHDLVCYVNADVILRSDFIRATRQIVSWRKQFLVIGGRWDVDITEPWDFSSPDWEHKLDQLVAESGNLMDAGTDYFIFPRGLFRDIPHFALGRTAWDCWLLWKALQIGVPLISATADIKAIHQNHASTGDWSKVCSSPEANHNSKLAGNWAGSYTPSDANYQLADGLVRACRWSHYKNRLRVMASWCRACRSRLGLTRANLSPLTRLLSRSTR